MQAIVQACLISNNEKNSPSGSLKPPLKMLLVLLQLKKDLAFHLSKEEYGITEQDILSKDWDSPDRIARWQKTITEGGDTNRLWIAKEGENIVGSCSASKGIDQNQIRAIYVLPDYQGKGIGKKLMERAVDWLGDEKDIMLEVAKYNTDAIDFYKRVGFEEGHEIIPSLAGQLPSGKLIPEIEMIKRCFRQT